MRNFYLAVAITEGDDGEIVEDEDYGLFIGWNSRILKKEIVREIESERLKQPDRKFTFVIRSGPFEKIIGQFPQIDYEIYCGLKQRKIKTVEPLIEKIIA